MSSCGARPAGKRMGARATPVAAPDPPPELLKEPKRFKGISLSIPPLRSKVARFVAFDAAHSSEDPQNTVRIMMLCLSGFTEQSRFCRQRRRGDRNLKPHRPV